MSESIVRVVVTGPVWMGSGAASIETTLEELLREAGDEIISTVYAISAGSDLLFEWIEGALDRGVRVKMVVNRLGKQHPTAISRLLELVHTYRHFELYDFSSTSEEDLHAKVVMVDRKTALIGSSNLSRRGLVANLELAILIDGGDAIIELARVLDLLFRSQNIVPVL